MKNFIESLKLIQAACTKVNGLAIVIDADKLEIYWKNLRVTQEPEKIPEALKAINKLNKLGAIFE
jgi:hypothetical protein